MKSKFNAGLYIDVKTLDHKWLAHNSIQSDKTKKSFLKNSKSVLFLLVGRKHENKIVTFDQATFVNFHGTYQSDKYEIITDQLRIVYWYLYN